MMASGILTKSATLAIAITLLSPLGASATTAGPTGNTIAPPPSPVDMETGDTREIINLRSLISLEKKNISLLIDSTGRQVTNYGVIVEAGMLSHSDSDVGFSDLKMLFSRERTLRSAIKNIQSSHEEWVTNAALAIPADRMLTEMASARNEDRLHSSEYQKCSLAPVSDPDQQRFLDSVIRWREGDVREVGCIAEKSSLGASLIGDQVMDAQTISDLNDSVALAAKIDNMTSPEAIHQREINLNLTLESAQNSHQAWIVEQARLAEVARLAEIARLAEEARVAAEQAAAAAARANRGGSSSKSSGGSGGSSGGGETPQQYLEGIAGAYGGSISWSDAPCGRFSGGIGGCFQGGSTVYVSTAAYASWSSAKGRGRNVVLHEVSHMIIQRTCGTVMVGGDRFENVTDAYTVLLGGGATGYGYNDNDMAIASAAVGGTCE